MATIEHVEGRIAFLRTELKIIEAQATAWNAFAGALRANAQKLGEVPASMMRQPRLDHQQATTIAERLDLQEQWLLDQLESAPNDQIRLHGILGKTTGGHGTEPGRYAPERPQIAEFGDYRSVDGPMLYLSARGFAPKALHEANHLRTL